MGTLRFGVPLVAWAIALYCGLQLNRLDLGHSICGPWGCGPPTSALMAMHAFWLLTLIPVAILLAKAWPRFDWHRVGLGILAIAVLVIVGISVHDYLAFQKNAWEPIYAWQRCLFRLATLSDFPVVQLGLAGLVLSQLGRRELIEHIASNGLAVSQNDNP